MNRFNGVLLMSESGVNSFVKQMHEAKLENDHHAVAASEQSIGSMLARARLEREWTVQQVADQLKLSPKQIVALEENKFDDLPKLVIVRGFVRTYAKLLKIDADPLVALLPKDAQHFELQETLKPALSTPFMESRLSLMGRQDSNRKYMLGAAFLVTFAVGFFVVQKTDFILSAKEFFVGKAVTAPEVKPGSVVLLPAISEVSISKPEIIGQPSTNPSSTVTGLPENEIKVVQSEHVLPQLTQQVSSGAAPNNEIRSNPAISPIANSPNSTPFDKDTLKLKFRQDSWIQVKKENGVIVTSHLAKAGTEEVFSVKELLQVRIGNAAGVDGFLRGTPLEILAEKGSNVVNLNVK
jgi:cytoskeleton protein RodZ